MSATIIENYTLANTIAWHKKWPICTLKDMQYEKGFCKKYEVGTLIRDSRAVE